SSLRVRHGSSPFAAHASLGRAQPFEVVVEFHSSTGRHVRLRHVDRKEVLMARKNLWFAFLILLLVGALMAGLPRRGMTADITWTNAAGGNWSNAANWNPI